MDEQARLFWLVNLLDFENMPKVIKKRCLFEACKILDLHFSNGDLEKIERKFLLLERRSGEYTFRRKRRGVNHT